MTGLINAELKQAEKERDAIEVLQEDDIREYYELRQLLKEKGQDFQAVISHPTYSLPFLNSGRLVEVRDGERDFGWAVVVAFNKIINPRQGRPVWTENDPPQKQYLVDVLALIASDSAVSRGSNSQIEPPRGDDKGTVAIIPISLATVQSISQIRVKLPNDLRQQVEKDTAFRAVAEVKRRFPEGPSLLDPIKNMGINDKSFRDLVKQIAVLEQKLDGLPITKSVDLPRLYDLFDRKEKAIENVKSLKRKINSVHDVLHLEELKSRKRVLRRLGFTTSDDVVEMKGRVACEISTGDELMLTEMMFGGVFNPLAPEQCAALLSCFVFQERVSQRW